MVADQKGHASRHESGGTDSLPNDAISSSMLQQDSVGTTAIDQGINVTWTTQQTFQQGMLIEDKLLAAADLEGQSIIYDFDKDQVPLSILEANSLTVAGNSVKLGNSTSINHSDISSINTDDHHAKFTAEEAQDAFGSLLTGTQTLINISYDDVNNEVDFVVQEGSINHDNLTGFVSDEHIDHSSTSISAGTHLTGGGDLTASRTLNVDETGIEADNLAGNNGTSGQFLQTDGSNLSFATVNTFSGDHADLSNVLSSQHHTRPSAGSYLTDSSNTFSVNLGSGVEGDGSDNIQTSEQVAFETGHTAWASGLSNAEIHRLNLQSGETFVVERIEYRQKGGGSSTNSSVDVFDNGSATVIGSQNLGGTTKDAGSSNSGSLILVRINNSTGGSVTGSVRVVGYIEGA